MKLKQNDLALLAAALIGGLIVAFITSKYLFSNSASQDTQVDVVPAIHTNFPQPSSTYFNSQAVDPTQIINISPNNTTSPFNTAQ